MKIEEDEDKLYEDRMENLNISFIFHFIFIFHGLSQAFAFFAMLLPSQMTCSLPDGPPCSEALCS